MDRQKEILNVFNNDKDLTLKKSEIIEKGDIHYYASTSKHVGFTLTRMVRNGLLIRVKMAYYKLGYKKKTRLGIKLVEDENQQKLF